MHRGGGFGRVLADEGVGAVRAVQHGDGHAVVPHRLLLLHDACFVLPVHEVHERPHGERDSATQANSCVSKIAVF